MSTAHMTADRRAPTTGKEHESKWSFFNIESKQNADFFQRTGNKPNVML
jgi:hypothetical protein